MYRDREHTYCNQTPFLYIQEGVCSENSDDPKLLFLMTVGTVHQLMSEPALVISEFEEMPSPYWK